MEYRTVDKKNPSQALLGLKLDESQRTYLDPVQVILKDYQDLDNWRILSIHLDDEEHTMIGFTCIGIDHGHEAWIDDIMIDKEYQGKGYGKQALSYLMNYLMSEYNTNEVYLSCFEHNVYGLNFYAHMGFERTDRRDINGEIILVYRKK